MVDWLLLRLTTRSLSVHDHPIVVLQLDISECLPFVFMALSVNRHAYYRLVEAWLSIRRMAKMLCQVLLSASS